jgi:ABC-2 type transport system ATP-binding protein
VRLLTGIEQPTEGEVHVLGTPPAAFGPDDRGRMGYMPQLSVLFPSLSLLENLNFTASLYGMPLRRRGRLREALGLVELWDERHKRLKDASGGMQRRLALAAAVVHGPELLFLDEPTAGVDPVLRRKFWTRFGELRNEGRTLFVTTQYVSEAAYCDLVGVISAGRLIAFDTPDGLRRQAYGGDLLEVHTRDPIRSETVHDISALPYVRRCTRIGDDERGLRVTVDEGRTASPRLSDWFDDRAIPLESVDQDSRPFDDVFVELVERSRREVS